MSYEANDELFCFSNSTDPPSAQTDPLISIGGWAPVNFVAASRMYRPANTDAPHITAPNRIHDTQIDGNTSGLTGDPVTGDWCWIMKDPNAGVIGKVIADDQVSVPGSIDIDREIPDTTSATNNFRIFKRENLFDNVDAADAVDGYVDYRQIWYIHNDQVLNADGWRMHVEPLKANGCTIEIAVAAAARTTDAAGSQPFIYLPADRFEDPFDERGVIKDLSVQNTRYSQMERRGIHYSPDNPMPFRGMNDDGSTTDQWFPIWIKRTIRPGTRAGECAFKFVVRNPNGDGVGDPASPYESGFIFSFFVSQPTYSIAISQDRIAYTDRSARLTATITDDRGVAVPNLNAWMVLDSGPGSIVSDQTLRTDANGKITALYNSPSATGADPVVRVVIPTNTET